MSLALSFTGNTLCKHTAAFTSQSSLQMNSCPHTQSIQINYSQDSQDSDLRPSHLVWHHGRSQIKAVAFHLPAIPKQHPLRAAQGVLSISAPQQSLLVSEVLLWPGPTPENQLQFLLPGPHRWATSRRAPLQLHRQNSCPNTLNF